MEPKLSAEIINDIKNVGISNLQMWLSDNNIEYTTGNNFFKGLEAAIAEKEISIETIYRALAELEENSDKKIQFLHAKGFDEVNKNALLKKLKIDHNILVSENKLVRVKAKETPTFNYFTWQNNIITLKYSEKHYKIEADYENNTWEEKEFKVFVIIIIDLNDGLVQLRFDSPGNRHKHKNSNKKSSEVEYERYYHEKLATLFPDLEFIDLNFTHVARKIVNDREIPFLIHKGVNTIANGGKLIHSLKFMEDIRDRSEYKAAAASDGAADWLTEDLSGFWVAAKSDDQLTRDLFMRISRKKSEVRVQRGCLEKELNYGIAKIREIQKGV